MTVKELIDTIQIKGYKDKGIYNTMSDCLKATYKRPYIKARFKTFKSFLNYIIKNQGLHKKYIIMRGETKFNDINEGLTIGTCQHILDFFLTKQQQKRFDFKIVDCFMDRLSDIDCFIIESTKNKIKNEIDKIKGGFIGSIDFN